MPITTRLPDLPALRRSHQPAHFLRGAALPRVLSAESWLLITSLCRTPDRSPLQRLVQPGPKPARATPLPSLQVHLRSFWWERQPVVRSELRRRGLPLLSRLPPEMPTITPSPDLPVRRPSHRPGFSLREAA